MPELKTLPLHEAKVAGDGTGPGELSGLASAFGGVDDYGDTIEQGAYAETIPQFLKDGFIAWSHDWENPVATPLDLREDARGLFLTAQFHTDGVAQRARTITAERLERGKSMGLSIGYEALDVEYRTVDEPVHGMHGQLTDKIRVLKRIRLFEISLVTVPADPLARVTSAKSLRYAEETDRVLADFSAWVSRTKSLADMLRSDQKAGRPISAARRERMAGHLAVLRERVSADVSSVADDIEALLAETAPPDPTEPQKAFDARPLWTEFQHTLARLHGVAV